MLVLIFTDQGFVNVSLCDGPRTSLLCISITANASGEHTTCVSYLSLIIAHSCISFIKPLLCKPGRAAFSSVFNFLIVSRDWAILNQNLVNDLNIYVILCSVQATMLETPRTHVGPSFRRMYRTISGCSSTSKVTQYTLVYATLVYIVD